MDVCYHRRPLPPHVARPLINTATQQLYNNTQSGAVTSSGYVSRHGLTTVCAYAANTTLFQLQHVSLVNWIAVENAIRSAEGASGADLVRLLVDETVPDMGVDGSVYKSYYDQCPDNVDALFLLINGMGAIEGMAASQLRAKAVVGLTGNSDFNTHDPSQVASAAGVLYPIPVDDPLITNIPRRSLCNVRRGGCSLRDVHSYRLRRTRSDQ